MFLDDERVYYVEGKPKTHKGTYLLWFFLMLFGFLLGRDSNEQQVQERLKKAVQHAGCGRV